ncbi:MAG TPA: SRPBCC family protein [Chloroflexia bacterium]|nr:SRPBCC family protein [Chloroflexia bacterium]
MRRFEHTELTNRPVAEVFRFLSDFANNSQWEPGVLESKQISPGPLAIGAELSDVRKVMGRRVETTYEVTEYEPDRKFGLKSNSGPVRVRASYTFEPVDGSTRVTDRAEFETTGLFKLAEPLFARSVEKQMKANFAKIKQLLETRS